jgi:hypothetical protein
MVKEIGRKEFLDFAYGKTDLFMQSIATGDAYIVKAFYPRETVEAFKQRAKALAEATPPSWHPCLDGVPDYHRINDEYEGSWVKARMHGFYFHAFNENRDILETFKEILELKNHLRGAAPNADFDAVPSAGVISRVVSQHYPVGGGYLREHVDPHSPFALLQTIVQASTPGVDYEGGGLYMRTGESDEPTMLDPYSDVGDLFALTPDVRHGVAAIDPARPLDWSLDRGRWMILPIVIRSDYNMDPATKPRQVA